jgi:hypothetical protein
MKFIADIAKKDWLVDEEDLSSFYVYINVGFRDNEELPVVFSGLEFGYSLKLNSTVVFEEMFPPAGTTYVSTDEDFLYSSLVSGLIPEEEYVVHVWAKNSGEFWERSVNVVLPPTAKEIPIPYPDDNLVYEWNSEEQNWIPVDENNN